MTTGSTRIIYDIGANIGDDIPYYLLKADKVVAAEANPDLCDQLERRFAQEINSGQLTIVRGVITAESSDDQVIFYRHRDNHQLSQFAPPEASRTAEFESLNLPAFTISDIIRKHGQPYYVKIDIEGHDEQVLSALFAAKIRPPYLSAESHNIRIFALLVAEGGYNSFKIVDGYTVSERYSGRSYPCHLGGHQSVAFPYHSSGPFGNDLDGPWRTADDFSRVLFSEGLGWKDIHVSNIDMPDPAGAISMSHCFRRYIRKLLEIRIRNLSYRLRSRC